MIEEILSTKFARKAIETKLICQENRPCAANVFRCLLEEIDRLAKSCQLTEFTDHGLPHLLSLVNRIETWTIKDGSSLINILTHDETCLLFCAVLIHDIGMLSQRESDLTKEDQIHYARQFADLSGWVRRTHVLRIEGITRRILKNEGYEDFLKTDCFHIICDLARSHNYWPDDQKFMNLSKLDTKFHLEVLAGILAIADLLDEDSSRCDSMTLFANKTGTLINRAHWLRHMLTANYLQIANGIIEVTFQEPNNLKNRIDGAFIGLENHLNQCQRYNMVLSNIGAGIVLIFKDRISCGNFPDNDDELAMLYCQPNIHILRTFQNENLPPATNEKPQGTDIIINDIKIKTIDRKNFDIATGISNIGQSSGKTDYEITYLASLLSGEDSRRKAAHILQIMAWQLHDRGDIIENRRLSSFVLEETIKFHQGNKNFLLDDNIYWAAVFLIHWANNEADLYRVSSLFDPLSMRGHIDINTVIKGINLPWKIVALTCYLIFHHDSVKSLSLIEEIFDEQINNGGKIESEIDLAWYNLIEALWGLGYLIIDSEKFWQKFKLIQNMEADEGHPVLRELSWRMSIQSQCLIGLNRWQFIELSRDRIQHHLTREPGRESLAEFWWSWFHDGKLDVENVCMANPHGSEFYIAGLETAYLSEITEPVEYTPEKIKNIYSVRQTLREARESDQSYSILGKIKAGLLADTHEPKDEDVVYLYKRDVKLLPTQFFIGERIALRRWFLEGWRNLVHTNIQRILNMAYALSLEEENVPEAIIFCLSEIAWTHVDNKAEEKIEKILEMNETKLSSKQINKLIEQMLNSFSRISKINHPGLKLLGDTIAPEFVPKLIELTLKRLKIGSNFNIKDYVIWINILPYIEMSPEQWNSLNGLVIACLSWPQILDSNSRQIVSMFIQLAPWDQVSDLLEKIIECIEIDDVNPDWFDNAKDSIVMNIINRDDEGWKGSIPIKKFISILRNGSDVIKCNKDDLIMAEWLETPNAEHIGPQYKDLSINMVERIEQIATRAVARTSKSSYGGGGNYARIMAKLPPIPDTLANRSAEALNRLWDAPYPTFEEVNAACEVATYILRSASSTGLTVLLEALFKGMESERLALDMGGEKDRSEAPWELISENLDLVPDSMIDRVYGMIIHRITDSSLCLSASIAACLVEILMRASKSEVHNSSYIMLLAIRIKINNRNRYNSVTFVRAVERYVANIKKGFLNEDLLKLLVEWSKNVLTISGVKYRYETAQALKRLFEVTNSEIKDNIESMIESLKSDPHLKIRDVFKI